MNSSAKKFLGTGLTLGLAVVSLCAQNAATFGSLPLWFEASRDGRFIAHGSASEFVVSASGTELSLKKSSGETAVCTLQFLGANPTPRIFGDQMLAGQISHFAGSQPEHWQAGQPTFARVQLENVYPGVNVVYYGNQRNLEYDFNLAAGVSPAVITLRFDGAEKISLNPQGDLLIKIHAGEIVQHAPVAYQMVQGTRQTVAAGYKILDGNTAAFALGNYDHSEPLVIDPVLTYSTYYGGNYGDTPWAIAVHPTDGSVYVAGQTFSTKGTNNFPFSTPGTFQTNSRGGKLTGDAFVARFDHTGSNLIYATYLGGSGNDGAMSLAVDDAGNAYLAGYTDSTNFPTKNAIFNKIKRSSKSSFKTYAVDAFVTKLNPAGNALLYSTYLGGDSMDSAFGIALDALGKAYVTGLTYSTNFPVTPNAFQTRLACSNTVYFNCNAFVSVLAAGGSNLSYSTFLGGTNFDQGRAIAYKNNQVFVTGFTYSTNFPVINFITNDTPRFKYINGNLNKDNKKKLNGASDAFVTAFNASSTNLTVLYSTLLGGTNNDFATSIAADGSGNAYVAGYTLSTNFPYTSTNVAGLTPAFVLTNDFSKRYALVTNGFLTQITRSGGQTAIGYSTMFGGVGVNVANGVALDPEGNAYVIGSATCTNFPVTTNNISGYLSATNNSRKKKDYSDAFVIVFNTNASALLYSTYLGGYLQDYGHAIAVDPLGNAYLAGQTLSENSPAVQARQAFRNGTNDMFIAKISQATNAPTLSIVPQVAASPAVRANVAGSPPSNQPGITLKWKMFPADYTVESTADVAAPNWQIVPQSPTYTNGWYDLSLPTTNGIQFFRLHPN